eukprot:m51a1_g12725 putative casein kinase (267) ;mRNA; f:2650-3523
MAEAKSAVMCRGKRYAIDGAAGTVAIGGRPYFVKRFRPEGGGHDESILEHEMEVLDHLWKQGVLCVPQDARMAELVSGGDVLLVPLASGTALSSHRWPLERAVAEAVVDAFVQINAAGVLHRDIKPQHIFIDGSGPSPKVTVIDFGLSSIVAKTDDAESLELLRRQHVLNREHALVWQGNAPYASLLAHLGAPLDEAADLLSLGYVLYDHDECRSKEHPQGRLPWEFAVEEQAASEAWEAMLLRVAASKLWHVCEENLVRIGAAHG